MKSHILITLTFFLALSCSSKRVIISKYKPLNQEKADECKRKFRDDILMFLGSSPVERKYDKYLKDMVFYSGKYKNTELFMIAGNNNSGKIISFLKCPKKIIQANKSEPYFEHCNYQSKPNTYARKSFKHKMSCPNELTPLVEAYNKALSCSKKVGDPWFYFVQMDLLLNKSPVSSCISTKTKDHYQSVKLQPIDCEQFPEVCKAFNNKNE